tara:strand:- start:8430 stop:8975 length:546 start_codon:yes stop_codon:yes gene_type:complete
LLYSDYYKNADYQVIIDIILFIDQLPMSINQYNNWMKCIMQDSFLVCCIPVRPILNRLILKILEGQKLTLKAILFFTKSNSLLMPDSVNLIYQHLVGYAITEKKFKNIAISIALSYDYAITSKKLLNFFISKSYCDAYFQQVLAKISETKSDFSEEIRKHLNFLKKATLLNLKESNYACYF